MPKSVEKIHLYICAVAALIVTITCIAVELTLFQLAYWVSITIVVFYIVGQAVRLFLTYKVFAENEEVPVESEDEMLDEDLDLEAAEEDVEPQPEEDAFMDSLTTTSTQ